jgi:hypothetical protein
MPQKPLPLIISLKRWREQNGFSQSDAVKVLNNSGIPVTLDSHGSLRALEIKMNHEVLNRLDEIFPGPGGPAPEAYTWG